MYAVSPPEFGSLAQWPENNVFVELYIADSSRKYCIIESGLWY